ncbi:MAG TPA: tRNA (guanosine(37)-N1)-methyltransferase TrmD [Acidobacteriaceae bacterium]|nr:tRNA (guanosine(37)-N1)-methyltransferase TrmD [Acidobacteriaceae bacterium]
MTMRFDILTLFPNFFSGPLHHGILSRAIATGTVQVALHDLRDFTHDRHRTVDDRPFGGGEGMVLKPQPIFDCIESLYYVNQIDTIKIESDRTLSGISPPIQSKSTRDTSRQSVILLSAQGKPFSQATAHRLASLQRVVLICGRYEGVDERVADLLADQELSIGDYILSGGELAAAVVLDATVRLLPGVLGHADSARYESFGVADSQPGDPADDKTSDGVPRSTHGSGGILDYPHYTRPADFRGAPIPEVLANGDHLAIRRWRRQAALAKTLRNRPDLLAHAPLTPEDRAYLATLGYIASTPNS